MFCNIQTLKICPIQTKILSSFVFFHHITLNHFLEMISSLIFNFTDFKGKPNSFLLNHAFCMNLHIFFCYAIFLLREHIFCRILSVCFLVLLWHFYCCCLPQSLILNDRTANNISGTEEICNTLRHCFF